MVLPKITSWWKDISSQLSKEQPQVAQPLKQSHLQVKTDLHDLAEVLQWLEAEVFSLLPRDRWWECQTALAEGFTNAVRHAHRNLPPTTPIEIDLTIFPHYLEMQVWDIGPPFDLKAKLKAVCEETFDPLDKEDGRGLLFMHQLTDELFYIRSDDRKNCLVMRKKLLDE
ncbi:ATP-binding protein [Oxynema sp. CENA135]|uniref:ATP-binding protein n=1 Tax=Oxynema sp. CENA135 TaxID=984206 RepID=UPI00190A5675|nr:ATP-binding protein [Oxynema sp. CENA135]MBK4729719.1 ATP-binding protein [Oxynema sp. CENA135]